MKTLTINDFCIHFGCEESELEESTRTLIEDENWDYEEIEGLELNCLYEKLFATVVNKKFSQARDHATDRWEKGWKENLEDFKKNNFSFTELVPKYIRPGLPIRLNGKYVKCANPNFELRWYKVMRDWFIRHYLSDFDAIYEFGSGSGHNVAEMATIFPNKKIYGFDWVQPSVDIVNNMHDNLGLNVKGELFNFFKPNYDLNFENNSAVLTMGALEQTGVEHHKFFQFLLDKSPKACFHLEPVYEFYDQNNLNDYLASRAHEGKNFWRGFPDRLSELKLNGSAQIIRSKRVPFGSALTEGYSQIFWRPLKNHG